MGVCTAAVLAARHDQLMSHVEPQQSVCFQSLVVSAQSSSAHLRSALLNSATERCTPYDDALMTQSTLLCIPAYLLTAQSRRPVDFLPCPLWFKSSELCLQMPP